MNLLIIVFVFFMIYSAIVRATYLKFKNNGITFNFIYKLLITLLPLVFFFIYVRVAIKFFPQNKKKFLQIFTIGFLKYPVILGSFIEIILESAAECQVYGDSKYFRVKTKKRKAQNPLGFNLASLRLKEIVELLKKESNFEKELLAINGY